MKYLYYNLFSIFCVLISAYLVATGGYLSSGWGWFLFVGVITHVSPTGSDS